MAASRGWSSLRILFSPVGGKVLLASAAGAMALIFLMTGVIVILEKFGVTVTESPSILSADDLRRQPLAIAAIVIIGPLGEELMFRGLLLDWLRQKLAPWLAIALISLVFALLHDNGLRNGAGGWIAFAERFLVAVGASILVLRYNSLRPAFVLHATNNCEAVAAVMLSAS
jgi:membrane protease YdiL (CAAX protease family)